MSVLKKVFISSITLLTLSGCYEPVDEYVHLEQGWTTENNYRDISYNLTQGSKLLPYEWFISLETPFDRTLIKSDEVIDSLRFLPDLSNNYTLNPDNLPVGFTKDLAADGYDWFGITCAACHTAQINYNNIGIRVDGAPAMGDFIGLLSLLKASLEETQADKAKFKRFAKRILKMDSTRYEDAADLASISIQLNTELPTFIAKIDGILKRNDTTTLSGFGRVDAFGSIANELFVDDLGQPDNFRQNNAPVSYPFLWDTPQLERVQWIGNLENSFARNVGEVLGVFGEVELQDPAHLFATSAKGENIFHLEEMLKSLTAPKWPEEILGEIDTVKAELGKRVYETPDHTGYACVSCHTLADEFGNFPLTPAGDNAFGKQFIKTYNIPLAEIGTDTNTADQIFTPFLVQTGALAPLVEGSPVAPLDILQTAIAGLTVRGIFAELQLSEIEQAIYSNFRVYTPGKEPAPDVPAYKARPLNGIWATSPYLHNGSVRTLTQLLVAPEEREESFWVGTRTFDPENVGFNSKAALGYDYFDTSLSGNRAIGHEYGTQFSANEKAALVEFMKTL